MSGKSLLVIGVLTFVTLRAAALAPFLAVAAVTTRAAAAASSPAVPVVPPPPVVDAPAPALALTPAARAAADALPADAKAEVDQFRREAARIRADAEAKIAAQKADLVQRLLALQTKYTKEGKLDEAVAIRDRICLLEGAPAVVQRAPVKYGRYGGVEVQWGGTWWPAEVLQVRGNQYYIHYTGWSNSWDEWVPECRIRPCGPRGTSYRR
jgi:hypothetical protein